MPDLDQLLGSDISRSASREAQSPGVEAVVIRGYRRRRQRSSLALAICSLLVVTGAVGTQLRDGGRTAPGPADRSTGHRTEQTEQTEPAPAHVIDDPDSRPAQVATAPGDADVRAALWRLCNDPRCRRSHTAIALTSDGFRTRTVVGVRQGRSPVLTPAGTEGFVVTGDGRVPYLLHTDGTRLQADTVQQARPVVAGEVVVRDHWNPSRFLAIDPESGQGHVVPTPDGAMYLSGGSGLLQALVPGSARTAPRFFWSHDGGASWREHQLPKDDNSLFQLVPSAASDTMAVIGGGDGATLFPLAALYRGTRDGASWQVVERGKPTAYGRGVAVLPDRRLMVEIEAWSDQRAGAPAPRPVGLYLSDGGDWADLSPMTVPGDMPPLAMIGQSVRPGEVTTYLAADDDADTPGTVYAVQDGGETWTTIAMR